MLEDLLYIIKDGVLLGLIWGVMAIGVFISFRVLDFADLTAEGSVTLGGAVVTNLILSGMTPILATLISFLVGMLAGLVTGVLHAKLKIPAILAGIITMTGLYTINLRVLGRASQAYTDNNLTIFNYLDEVPADYRKMIISLLIIVLVVLAVYWFFGTEIGTDIRATGMNPKMARAQGINTNVMIILGLMISNGLIALSGALQVQTMRNANMDIGKGIIIIGLGSIILGEVIFGKRSFKNWLISVVLGSIIYQMLVAVAINLGMDANDLKLIQAILIALILSIPVIKPGIIKLISLLHKEKKKC